MPPGLIIAAPASGSGKTVVTLGLLRALRRQGISVASFKVGPDYIDPAFHSVACGRDCVNLDVWAMRPQTLCALATRLGEGAEVIVGEGVMGLFDGAADGGGSTADLAALMGWPVVLVVDVRGQGASVAAVIKGFATLRSDIDLVGVVFNRVGSPAHAETLCAACESASSAPVLGCIPYDTRLALPERYLGLVQAVEHSGIDAFLDVAADVVVAGLDSARILGLARTTKPAISAEKSELLPPLGQNIAVALDAAFAFSYPWILNGWRAAGAELAFFSPLNDEAPPDAADAIYLPGGYPELHAGRLADSLRFMVGLRAAARRNVVIYGECGGYMVMGRSLVDAAGIRHEMAGLVPHETSFAERRLHLGYRRLRLSDDCPLGRAGSTFRGHEFHYGRVSGEDAETPLFHSASSTGDSLPPAGCAKGNVTGSVVHLIDQASE
jgi:cobyrinic acid a,c-diamide synthase